MTDYSHQKLVTYAVLKILSKKFWMKTYQFLNNICNAYVPAASHC
jgi:hypothetical protein